MVKKGLMKQVIEVKRIFSWIIVLLLVVNKNIFSVIPVYGPQHGRNDADEGLFMTS